MNDIDLVAPAALFVRTLHFYRAVHKNESKVLHSIEVTLSLGQEIKVWGDGPCPLMRVLEV